MPISVRIRAVHLSLALALLPWPLEAAQVQVIALTEGKATLVIDNAKPRTLAVGQVSPEGVKLIAATAELADLMVLHLDKDFELIAELTGQPTQRLDVH